MNETNAIYINLHFNRSKWRKIAIGPGKCNPKQLFANMLDTFHASIKCTNGKVTI